LFQFPQVRSSTISAAITRDGVTTTGTTDAALTLPDGFDFLALMLTDYERPTAVSGRGAGLAFLTAQDVRLKYVVTWSASSGPAVAAHIHGAGSSDDVTDILVNLPVTPQPDNCGVLTGAIRAEDIRSVQERPAILLEFVGRTRANRQRVSGRSHRRAPER
jgi:hypothetical protein